MTLATLVTTNQPTAPQGTFDDIAEEMLNGMFCHYEPPKKGKKHRGILKESKNSLLTHSKKGFTAANEGKSVRWSDKVEQAYPKPLSKEVHCNVAQSVVDGCVEAGWMKSPTQAQEIASKFSLSEFEKRAKEFEKKAARVREIEKAARSEHRGHLDENSDDDDSGIIDHHHNHRSIPPPPPPPPPPLYDDPKLNDTVCGIVGLECGNVEVAMSPRDDNDDDSPRNSEESEKKPKRKHRKKQDRKKKKKQNRPKQPFDYIEEEENEESSIDENEDDIEELDSKTPGKIQDEKNIAKKADNRQSVGEIADLPSYESSFSADQDDWETSSNVSRFSALRRIWPGARGGKAGNQKNSRKTTLRAPVRYATSKNTPDDPIIASRTKDGKPSKKRLSTGEDWDESVPLVPQISSKERKSIDHRVSSPGPLREQRATQDRRNSISGLASNGRDAVNENTHQDIYTAASFANPQANEASMDDVLERQSMITAHREAFDQSQGITDNSLRDDAMERESFITAHRQCFGDMVPTCYDDENQPAKHSQQGQEFSTVKFQQMPPTIFEEQNQVQNNGPPAKRGGLGFLRGKQADRRSRSPGRQANSPARRRSRSPFGRRKNQEMNPLTENQKLLNRQPSQPAPYQRIAPQVIMPMDHIGRPVLQQRQEADQTVLPIPLPIPLPKPMPNTLPESLPVSANQKNTATVDTTSSDMTREESKQRDDTLPGNEELSWEERTRQAWERIRGNTSLSSMAEHLASSLTFAAEEEQKSNSAERDETSTIKIETPDEEPLAENSVQLEQSMDSSVSEKPAGILRNPSMEKKVTFAPIEEKQPIETQLVDQLEKTSQESRKRYKFRGTKIFSGLLGLGKKGSAEKGKKSSSAMDRSVDTSRSLDATVSMTSKSWGDDSIGSHSVPQAQHQMPGMLPGFPQQFYPSYYPPQFQGFHPGMLPPQQASQQGCLPQYPQPVSQQPNQNAFSPQFPPPSNGPQMVYYGPAVPHSQISQEQLQQAMYFYQQQLQQPFMVQDPRVMQQFTQGSSQ